MVGCRLLGKSCRILRLRILRSLAPVAAVHGRTPRARSLHRTDAACSVIVRPLAASPPPLPSPSSPPPPPSFTPADAAHAHSFRHARRSLRIHCRRTGPSQPHRHPRSRSPLFAFVAPRPPHLHPALPFFAEFFAECCSPPMPMPLPMPMPVPVPVRASASLDASHDASRNAVVARDVLAF